MARTLETIRAEIIQQKQFYPELNGLNSTSPTSMWLLWVYVVAFVIWTLEQLWDVHKAEVETIAARAIAGTPRWYAHMAQQYQQGYLLTWNPATLKYEYAVDDPVSRIVKFSAVRESAGGLVFVKAAKQTLAGAPEPLTAPEKVSFTAYMNEIKTAGTPLLIISEVADLLKLDLDVHYDGIIPIATLQADVETAITAYIEGLPFDGTFRKIKLVDAIQQVEGVIDVKLNTVDAKFSSFPYAPVDLSYISYAGHMKIDPAFPLSGAITYVAV